MPDGSLHWRRNMYVCLVGSFTNVTAMTLLLPFLPLYVEQLGVQGRAAIVQWSGIAYGITFLGAGIMAPIWGKVADFYGRKMILMRACLAMAVCMSLIGVAENIYQLVGLRLLAGVLGGYASGAVVLVATQTPKEQAGWALGTLSIGTMAGTLLGPLVGGVLPGLIGLRGTFFLAGGVIFLAFLGTVFLIREDRQPRPKGAPQVTGSAWSMIPDRRPVIAMLATAMLLMLANMSVEPIITVYVAQFVPPGGDVVFTAGLVMAASAIGSVLAASWLGRLADRIGSWNLITICLLACGVLLIPQAFVTESWQLIGLRFLMGISLAGLLPAIAATIRHNVPQGAAGTILGYNTSAQYAGQVLGPLAGGFVGGHVGMQAVFLATTLIMFAGAAFNWTISRQVSGMMPDLLPKP
ncbi:MFS transporter [Pseudoroseomonas ludipueritiae]|uniref:MFS transporter n=1 Tax=Pseudoroseomonas ludipueritiae TaxID=198093 RepID=A0ABR7R5X4_9PROT|nr:MFS transporter [Pseudoroseomonas ludipueritiae]MBC9177138.1 MFS transporter [Pseudoroseomonas ludipueritiae]